MAETVRSLFDYRDPHRLDSDGEGVKPAPPLRGRGCGRKRKGTPVKVFVTHTEEESVPEHSFSPGDRKEAAENKRPTLDGPFYNTEPVPHNCGPAELAHDRDSTGSKISSCSASTPASTAPTPTPLPAPAPATAASAQALSLTPASTAPAAPTASAPAPTASSFPPSPNCRIREVHCGSQVRLVVIAIRDITKGEEITVDYSLTEWGENLGFRGTVSPVQRECNSDTENNNNIKKEDEPLSLSAQQRQQQQQQDYVTPSWSLSPSSSPISHSDASDSDAGDEDNASPRGRALRRRKKRRGIPSKKKTPHRMPPGRPSPVSPASVPHHNRPLSLSHPPAQSSPPCSSSSSPVKPVFKAPAPLGANSTSNVNTSVPRGGVSIDSMRQTCEYCGRHFRSLGRHLDKHHAHQPEVCSALVERYTQMPRLHAHNTNPTTTHLHTQQHSKSSQVAAQSRSSDLPHSSVQDLSMSPPTLTAANQSPTSSGRTSTPPMLTPPRGQNAVPVSVLKRSPPPVAVMQPRKGAMRRFKKDPQVEEEEDEDEEDVEVVDVTRAKEEDDVEVVYPQSYGTKLAKEMEPPKEEEEVEEEEEEEEEEENGVMEVDDESGAEDKDKDLLSGSGRHHLLPLLSSLSSLVLYLRRLQHSAFLSLSRQLQSAEAWRLLCHSSLALLILYNRRRECEVSKLSIAEYRARITPQCPVPVPPGAPPALTPLEASLSPFERLVLPHLPRVGVQGKRGRVQPLILPPHCEPCLELLLQTRQDVGVDPANPYVFARPYHSPATPLRGTDLLRSLARSSGTRNPRALTQTRVRRQVAILTQLLLLGEGEEPGQPGGSAVERLEHFLEREYHVTQSCAGIGQDPGLMGRVGRVVLCGERDGVLFRGMSLNHICLELDVMSGNSADSYSEGESDGEQVKEKPEVPSPAPTPTPTPTLLYVRKGKNNGRVGRPKKLKNTQPPPLPPPPQPINRRRGSGKRGVLKRPWSEAERAAVEEHLTRNITELRVPAKADCERCLQQCPLLVSNHRDWRAIKFYCHNRIQLLKKNQRRDSDPQPLTVC
ncbi:uncharacterized protein [Paralichthys olivaceus]|uniref:uncharacterized protein isoform X2 n=1 Tax=Paralichthys olivaceus TaxID=8255 RepID=UPI0037517E0E